METEHAARKRSSSIAFNRARGCGNVRAGACVAERPLIEGRCAVHRRRVDRLWSTPELSAAAPRPLRIAPSRPTTGNSKVPPAQSGSPSGRITSVSPRQNPDLSGIGVSEPSTGVSLTGCGGSELVFHAIHTCGFPRLSTGASTGSAACWGQLVHMLFIPSFHRLIRPQPLNSHDPVRGLGTTC